MNISEIENAVKYVTNADGEKTEVIISMQLWHDLLQKVNSIEWKEDPTIESGLDSIDENEPKSTILADLQASIQAVKAGETYPVSQLWNDLDD